MIVKVWLVRKKELVQHSLEVNRDNIKVIKILLNSEKNKLNKKIKQYQDREIKNNHLKMLQLSRKNILNSLRYFRNI